MLKIGNLTLEQPTVLAPMAGLTDRALRQLPHQLGRRFARAERPPLGRALAAGHRALVAWLIPAAYVFAAIMILFGAGGAAALGFAVLGFGLALPAGQGIRRLVGNKEGDSQPAVA